MSNLQHGDSRNKRNADDVRRVEIIDNVIKSNKDGSIRKKPGRKSQSSKSITIERINDQEISFNQPRAESVENFEFLEACSSNNKEIRNSDHDKALLRRRDLEIESLQEQIRDLHYEKFINSAIEVRKIMKGNQMIINIK